MNPNSVEIAFVLDRSGSMQPMVEPAIAGFNEFLRDQQAEAGEARFTLVLFDDLYEAPCVSVPIHEVLPLDTLTFVPRGSTALLDAIGKTIDDLGVRLAAMPESHRPGQVIVAILTDGQENASRHYSWHAISDRIRHQTDVYKWHFLFLGANQDAIATASQIGIRGLDSSTYKADHAGSRSSSKAISRKVAALRKMSQGVQDADLHTPMSEIVEQEDGKERDEK